MAKYANHVSNRKTPQNKKAKEGQIQNHDGCFVFKVDEWTRLNRFLIIGNEKGSYYASEREMAIENYDCILKCLKINSKKTVDTIVEISDSGRAVKNEPAIFALAVCCVYGDEQTRCYANRVMPKVARFSTAFFSWIDAVNTLKEGRKGKGLLRAIGRWYTEKDAVTLAYQICKYPGRSIGGNKWTHADALRLARISPYKKNGVLGRNGKALTFPTSDHSLVFNYATHGITTFEEMKKKEEEQKVTGKTQKANGLTEEQLNSLKDTNLKYIYGHEKCKLAINNNQIVSLIKEFNLTRESVPPHFRNDMLVQKALLPNMPMTALIRNLGSMTASGLLKSLSDEVSFVVDKITNEDIIKNSRIHPMSLILALKVYESGKGMRTTWKPVSAIKDALENAFYKSFKYVEPTGKKFLFGIDVSGSMEGSWYSSERDEKEISPREAAAVIAMTCAKTEKNYEMMAFSQNFIPLKITATDSLATVLRKTSGLPFDSTDCSLPMLYAIKHKLDVDVFVVLTDNETNTGKIHPFEALKRYRKEFNKEAKLAVLAFTATEFSIADPTDAGMIDIAGVDANVPKILSEFSKGNL